jgi:hypothetical protein
MAARYFIPQSGDWAWDGSVWAATATGAAGSAVTPVSTDDVYILSGTANIISSLNQSAVTLGSLTIGFNGTIGTSSTSLQVGLANGTSKLHISGACTVNLNPTGALAYGATYQDFSGVLNLTAGSLLSLRCGQFGSVNITSTVSELITCGADCTINAGASVPALVITGGNHSSAAALNAVDMSGGRSSLRVTGLGIGVTGSLYVGGASTYIHESSGTINSLIAYSGSRCIAPGTYGGFTVTSSDKYAGSEMFENPSVPITYTNATNKIGFR